MPNDTKNNPSLEVKGLIRRDLLIEVNCQNLD